MKDVKLRLKRLMVTLLSILMIVETPVMVLADDYDKEHKDRGLTTEIGTSGIKYSTPTVDINSKPYIKDGALCIFAPRIDAINAYGEIGNFVHNFEIDVAALSFQIAMQYMAYNQSLYQLRQYIENDAIEVGNDREGHKLIDSDMAYLFAKWDEVCPFNSNAPANITMYEADGFYKNPYSPWNADGIVYKGDTEAQSLTGQDMAEYQFNLFIQSLKGIGWKELNDVIDVVLNDDEFQIKGNDYIEQTVAPFSAKLWAELVSSGIVEPHEYGSVYDGDDPGRYDIVKFTIDDTYSDLYNVDGGINTEMPYGNTTMNIVNKYKAYYIDDDSAHMYDGYTNHLILQRNCDYSDKNWELADLFNDFRFVSAYDFSNRTFSQSSSHAYPLGVMTYQSEAFNGFTQEYNSEKYHYDGFSRTDIFNSDYMLINFMDEYNVLAVPDSSFVNDIAVTDIKVGDILAPHSLLFNGYDTDTDAFRYGIVYGDESFAYENTFLIDNEIDSSVTPRKINQSKFYMNYYDHDSYTDIYILNGEYDLSSLNAENVYEFHYNDHDYDNNNAGAFDDDISSVFDKFGVNYSDDDTLRFEYDSEKNIFTISRTLYDKDDTSIQAGTLTFDITCNDQHRCVPGESMLTMKIELTNPSAIIGYDSIIEYSEYYIAYPDNNFSSFPDRMSFGPSVVDPNSYFFNTIQSYYATRMCGEDNVLGYEVTDIDTHNDDYNNEVSLIKVKRLYSIDYTVSFETNCDAIVLDQEVAQGEKVTEPDEIVYEGHDFAGWYSDEDCTELYDFDTPVENNMTLYAKWNVKQYSVSFNSTGGTEVQLQTVSHGEKAVEPEEPFKTGHRFKNWLDGSATGDVYDFDTIVTEDKTLYADWSKESYRVNLEKGEGIASVSGDGIYEYGSEVSVGYELEPGFDFDGWSGDKETDSFIMPANDVTMSANAVRKLYHVHYDSNEGYGYPMRSSEKAYGVPITLSANTYKRDGFDFIGWNTERDGSGAGYDDRAEFNENENTILYAQWVPSGELAYQKVLDNRSGYDFYWDNDLASLKDILWETSDDNYLNTDDFWNAVLTVNDADYSVVTADHKDDLPKDTDFGTRIALDIRLNKSISKDEGMSDIVVNKAISETDRPMRMRIDISSERPGDGKLDNAVVYRIHNDIISQVDCTFNDNCIVSFESDRFSTYLVYGRWSHDIIFESNGGSAVPKQVVSDGGMAVRPDRPTKRGCVFDDWYVDTEFEEKYDFDTIVTENKVLYANWLPVYDVVFNTHGGEPVPSIQSITHGNRALKPDDPSKTGFSFKGWYVIEQDEWISYDFDAVVTHDLELHAMWMETHSVKFDAKGGKPEPAVQIVEHGDVAMKPAKNPVKSGYTFTGWYLDDKLYDFKMPIESDITLTAKYKADTVYHIVIFDACGGDRTPAAQGVLHGAKVSYPGFNPKKDGYDFLHWEYAGKVYDFNQPVYNDMVLSAIYKKHESSSSSSSSSSEIRKNPDTLPTAIVTFYPQAGSVSVSPSGGSSGYYKGSLSQNKILNYDKVQTGVFPFLR